jgi:hypothetical protein
LARRDGGKHRPDNGEVDCSGTAVPDASLTGVEVSKLAAMGVEDIGTHHIKEIYLFWLAQAISATPSRL